MPRLSGRTRVSNGIALLLRKRVGKRKLRSINTDTLDIGECFECVLGQLYGFYGTGRDELGLDAQTAFEHGFAGKGLSDDERPYNWIPKYVNDCRTLEREWIKQLGEL